MIYTLAFLSHSSHTCNIDTSNYVALGDSITAGYADGALYREAQLTAYPNIIASQFKKNAGDFKQPLMPDKSVGVNLDGESRMDLKNELGVKNYVLSRQAASGDEHALLLNNYKSTGPFNNMGVPGAKVVTAMMPGFGNGANGPGYYNPFFTRMASDPLNASMLSDALLMEPTFFSLFIGNNDALAFALSGGTTNIITPVELFEKSLRTIVNALTEKGAKGIIANLPSVEHIPYFTCMAVDGLVLSESDTNVLNAQYNLNNITFVEGKNYFVIEDPLSPQGLRQIHNNEFILLDLLLDPNKQAYLKGFRVIPKKYTLTAAQISEVQTANQVYNTIIHTVAREKELALVDIHGLLKTARPDRNYNPTSCNLDYARKGVFSLDGLHPNAFGQALIANAFIKEINQKFGCDFQAVKSNAYEGIRFPG